MVIVFAGHLQRGLQAQQAAGLQLEHYFLIAWSLLRMTPQVVLGHWQSLATKVTGILPAPTREIDCKFPETYTIKNFQTWLIEVENKKVSDVFRKVFKNEKNKY